MSKISFSYYHVPPTILVAPSRPCDCRWVAPSNATRLKAWHVAKCFHQRNRLRPHIQSGRQSGNCLYCDCHFYCSSLATPSHRRLQCISELSEEVHMEQPITYVNYNEVFMGYKTDEGLVPQTPTRHYLFVYDQIIWYTSQDFRVVGNYPIS